MSYTVHSLLHLSADVKNFGNLDSYSAFKFENYMQQLKKLIRKASQPLEQINNRISEKNKLGKKISEYSFRPIFSLSTRYPNNYCIILNKVFKMEEINNNEVKGRYILSLTNFFEYPIKSSDLGIYSSNFEHLSEQQSTFKIQDVSTKILKLQNKNLNVYILLQH